MKVFYAYFWGFICFVFLSCGEVSDCFVEYMDCKKGSESEKVRAICSASYDQCQDNKEKEEEE